MSAPEPMDRYHAEQDLSEAAELVRGILERTVEPGWLRKRTEAPLAAVLMDLETVVASMGGDKPIGDEK